MKFKDRIAFFADWISFTDEVVASDGFSDFVRFVDEWVLCENLSSLFPVDVLISCEADELVVRFCFYFKLLF